MARYGIDYTVRWGRVGALIFFLVAVPLGVYKTMDAFAKGIQIQGGGVTRLGGRAIRQPVGPVNGLVAWLPLDGDATNPVGTTTWTPNNLGTTSTSGFNSDGKFGGDLVSDGVDDSISSPDNALLDIGLGSRTWSVWLKLASLPATNKIVYRKSDGAGANGFSIQVGVSGFFTSLDTGTTGTATCTAALGDSQWHLITSVADRGGNTLTNYLDGVACGNVVDITALAATNLDATSQANLSLAAATGISGALDDFRLYSRALSVAEIQTLYKGSTPTNCDQTCVGWWKFDDGSGSSTAADSSPSANTAGTLTSMGTTQSSTSGWWGGVFGSGLVFDGVNDYVDAGSGSSYTTISTGLVTISAWVRNTNSAPASFAAIAGNGRDCTGCGSWNGYQLLMSTPKNLYFLLGNGANQYVINGGSATIQDNTWTHVVGTYDGATMRTYINGKLDATQVRASALSTSASASSFKIARLPFSATDFWQGGIDDVRVYNRALSDSEIADLYLAGR